MLQESGGSAAVLGLMHPKQNQFVELPPCGVIRLLLGPRSEIGLSSGAASWRLVFPPSPPSPAIPLSLWGRAEEAYPVAGVRLVRPRVCSLAGTTCRSVRSSPEPSVGR